MLKFENKKMLAKMEKLINYMYDFVDGLKSDYALNNVELCIVDIRDNSLSYDTRNLLSSFNIFTDILPIENGHFDFNPNKKEVIGKFDFEDGVMHDIRAVIYMSYQAVLELVIDCLLDFNDAKICVTTLLKHEFGHVLVASKFIGKTTKEYFEDHNSKIHEYEEFERKIKRRNCSIKNNIKTFMEYNSISGENDANEMTGVTKIDLINYCLIRSNEVLSVNDVKKLLK